MATTQYRSDASEAIYSAAVGLHRAKVIDETTMREYEASCIEKAPEYSPKQTDGGHEGV